MPKVSVVVVDYKNIEFTKLCLESLYRVTFKDIEIIVVENSSSRDSRKFYYNEQSKGKIRYLDLFGNQGLAYAENAGANCAKGKYLFFLNNDTIVKRDIFEKLLETDADIQGLRMFDYSGKKELDSCLSLDRFGYPCGKSGKFFYGDGAIFIKKSMFDKVGGFDGKMFLYGEDRDLFWRVRLSGGIASFCVSTCFYHNSSCTLDTNYMRRKISERNIIRSILKNYSVSSLWSIIPQYLFWAFLELCFILITNPKAIAKSYLPAYWWSIVNFQDTLKERRKIIRNIKDKDLPFSGVIGKLFVLQKLGIPKWRRGRYG